MDHHKDNTLTFKERQPNDKVHRYLFPLLVGDGITLKKKEKEQANVITLASVTFFHKPLNIKLYLPPIKVGGDTLISFVETHMTNLRRWMPMLKSMCN